MLSWYATWMRELRQSFRELEEMPLRVLLDLEIVKAKQADKRVSIEEVL